MKWKNMLAVLSAGSMLISMGVPALAQQELPQAALSSVKLEGTLDGEIPAPRQQWYNHISELNQLILDKIPQSERGSAYADSEGVYVFCKDDASRKKIADLYAKNEKYQDVPLYTIQSPHTVKDLGKAKKEITNLLSDTLGSDVVAFISPKGNKVIVEVETKQIAKVKRAMSRYVQSGIAEIRHTASMAHPAMGGRGPYINAYQARDLLIQKIPAAQRGPLFALSEYVLIANTQNSTDPSFLKTTRALTKDFDVGRLFFRDCPYTLAGMQEIQNQLKAAPALQDHTEQVIIEPEFCRVEVYLFPSTNAMNYIKTLSYKDAVTVFERV